MTVKYDKTITLDQDTAYDIAYGYPPEGTLSKVIDLDREKYHMRQLVLVRKMGRWYGFEFFDALDKHGESQIGDDYVQDKVVTLYEVLEKQTVEYEYRFAEKKLEDY